MLTTLPSEAKPALVAEELLRNGCVVVRDVLGQEGRDAIKRDLAPYLATAPTEVPGVDFYPGNTRRVTGIIAKSPGYRALVTHPLMLGVNDLVLKPNCSHYQVCTTAVLDVGPGATTQVLHHEEDLYPNFPFPRPVLVVATMWAIEDFTKANGGTRLVPGSHRWEKGRVAREDEVVAAEMPAGSVLFWLGWTLHGAGPNHSDRRRFGAFLSYNLGWLRQEENQYLALPPEVARMLPRDLQKLVGYQIHDPGLGFVGGLDPIKLLRAN